MRRNISRNGKMKQKLLKSNIRTLHLTNAHGDTHYYYLPFIAGKAVNLRAEVRRGKARHL